MAITGKQYAAEALKIYRLIPKAGYIYGAMNKLWTREDQLALERKYRSDPNKYEDYKLGAEYGSKWIGHRVWDCSGLTDYCAQQLGIKTYHHGSNSSYKYDCQYKGEKTPDMKLPIGAWVYTGTTKNRGHIGIVFDESNVIEAQGTKAGVVMSKLSLKKWTWWGLGKGMEFDFIPGNAAPVISTPVQTTTPASSSNKITIRDSMPTLRKGSTGGDVKILQQLLNKDRAGLAVDGIFGNKTLSAVKLFQAKKGLEADGIVGPKTWAALKKYA